MEVLERRHRFPFSNKNKNKNGGPVGRSRTAERRHVLRPSRNFNSLKKRVLWVNFNNWRAHPLKVLNQVVVGLIGISVCLFFASFYGFYGFFLFGLRRLAMDSRFIVGRFVLTPQKRWEEEEDGQEKESRKRRRKWRRRRRRRRRRRNTGRQRGERKKERKERKKERKNTGVGCQEPTRSADSGDSSVTEDHVLSSVKSTTPTRYPLLFFPLWLSALCSFFCTELYRFFKFRLH